MIQRLTIGLVLLCIALLPSAAFAEDECTADIRGKLMRKESGDTGTKLSAEIEVSAREDCADISFDLILVEEVSGGEQTEVRIPKTVRIRDSSSISIKVNYTLKTGRQIVSHRFEQTNCSLCER